MRFLFCFLSLSLFSQNHKFIYQFEYKVDTINTKSSDQIALLIKNNDIYFLSNKFIEIDSINNVTKYEKQFINPTYNNILVYSKNDNSFSTYKRLDLDYYSYEFNRTLKWELKEDTKIINGFKTQKAITNYGGRNWIAWFTYEIPLNLGPYVFYGLPGLILEIYDNEENFHYTIVKSSNLPNNDFSLEKIFERKPIKINKEDWKKIQLNYYNNPLYNYRTIGWTIYNKDGSKYSEQDYRNLEFRRREEIKRYNNPIELNEKINYK